MHVSIVAHSRIFRLFMKGKFDAYVLWPLAKRVQNWMVGRSTAPDFTVFIFFIKKNVVNHQYYKNSREMWKCRCMYNRKLLFLKWFYSILRGWFLKWQLLLTSLQWGGLIKRFCDVNKTLYLSIYLSIFLQYKLQRDFVSTALKL